jgi:hypothetical protein
MAVYVQTERGVRFEAFQWTGDPVAERPEWLQNHALEVDHHHGTLLQVGVYRVRPGSWVLRADRRGDIFPVPPTVFETTYTRVDGED